MEEDELRDRDFICPICESVMRDAVQTSNRDSSGEPCGHLFCKACINHWIADNARCPLCNAPLSPEELHDDVRVRRKIRQLRVRCRESKCGQTGVLGRDGVWWKQHALVCQYKMIACVYCSAKHPRSAMAAHVQLRCPLVLIPCPRCPDLVQRKELEKHRLECPRRLVPCPQCKQKGISCDRLAIHIEQECKETRVSCEFSSMGCPATFRRGDDDARLREKHARERMPFHMTLMMERIKMLEERVGIKRDLETKSRSLSPFEKLDKGDDLTLKLKEDDRKIKLTFLTPSYQEWNNQEQQSQLITAFGRKWYISIEPKTREGKDYLACYVHKRHGDPPIRGHINYIELVDRKSGDAVVSNSMADGLFKLFSDDCSEFPAWGWDNFTSISFLREKNNFNHETGQTILLRAEISLHPDDD